MNNIDRWLCLLLAIISLSSCKSEYQQYVEREMASGETRDSLIFGMRMGQTKKEFYTTCWDLNKQGVIHQGTGNATARYYLDQDSTGLNPEAKDMLFYGIFDENKIMRGMDISYSYLAWAPWNRAKHADSLMLDMRHQYEVGYPGNDFIAIELEQSEFPAYVKIDGNRQILMYAKDTKDIVVKIEDLRYKLNKEWK